MRAILSWLHTTQVWPHLTILIFEVDPGILGNNLSIIFLLKGFLDPFLDPLLEDSKSFASMNSLINPAFYLGQIGYKYMVSSISFIPFCLDFKFKKYFI